MGAMLINLLLPCLRLWREERSKATESFGGFSTFVVVVVGFPLCWAGV